MKSESEIQQLIQIEGPRVDCILMRNNSGALPDSTGRIVRYGLGNISKAHSDQFKSSDLIGITRVVITEDMVGQAVGVFTAIEVKDEKWNGNAEKGRELAQNRFIAWVKLNGGIAGFANSVASFRKLLGR